MELYILATSILFQLAAVVVAGLIAWTTLRRSWILIASAILLMAARRAISFYQAFVLDRSIDPVAESVALLISLLLFVGFVGLFLRERAAASRPADTGPRATAINFREPGAVAALLGILILLATSIVVYDSLKESRSAVIRSIFSANLRTARLLSTIADSPELSLSNAERIALVQDLWNQNPPGNDGGYICIINSSGELITHTMDRAREGAFVGDHPIEDMSARFSTIDDLLKARADWVGWYVTTDGESQIAAFSYSAKLASLVAVHVSKQAVERDILLGVLPLGAGLVFILAVLLPAALGVLYRAYIRTLRDVQSSEARYRAVVEDQTELVCRSLPDGTLTFANEAYCRCFDRRNDELVGHRFLPLIPHEDRLKVKEHIASLTRENPVATHEHRVVLPDGETRWFRWTNHAICEPGGAIVEIQGTGRDITERKRARERIARFGRIFEESVNEIYLFDVDTLKFIQVNRAAQINLGYTAEELLELSPLDLKPDFSPDLFNQLLVSLRNGEQEKVVFETRHRRKDHSLYDVEVHLQFLEIDPAPVFVAIILDITARKSAQAQKDEFDARSSAIIENAVDGIVTFDERQNVESVNPAALKLFGYTRPELVGKSIHMLMPEVYPGGTGGGSEGFPAVGSSMPAESAREARGQRKDGTSFPVKLSVSEVLFGDRRLFTGIIHDLTRERELEQQLLRAQKLDALGTLAGGIAHDFNNILHALLGFCRVAQENIGVDEAEVDQCLKEIEVGGLRAADLVDQILTFSRKADVEHRPAMLQPLVEEALRFLRNTIPATIEIRTELGAACGPVLANPTQVHQVVANLCTNAMHAMEKEGGVLTVSIEPVALEAPLHTLSGTLKPGAYVQLAVTDTGTGIESSLLSCLVDPFFTTKEPGKGTGLGLAMVHGIIASTGGGLIIESEVKQGTAVRVLLPALRGTQAKPVVEAPAATEGDRTGCILLVDDEEGITRMATLLLRSRGFAVEAYNDVGRALEALQFNAARFDAAVLDYTMPGKTGIDLARDILALNPDLPVILATGDLDRSKVEQPPNIVGVLKKPFRAEALLAIIENCM